jgi:hypothetical protein
MRLPGLLALGVLALLPNLSLGVAPWRNSGPTEETAAGIVGPVSSERDLASFVPEHCLFYADGHGLSKFLERGFEHPLIAALLRSELGRTLERSEAGGIERLLQRGSEFLETPLLPFLSSLCSGGIALAVSQRGGQAQSLLLLRAQNEESARKAVERFLDRIEEHFGFPGAVSGSVQHVRGTDIWSVGPDLQVARRDSLLLLSSDSSLLRESIELATDSSSSGMLARAAFVQARASQDGIAWAWLDLARLIETSNDEGLRSLPSIARNPGAQSLFGPGLCALASADCLSLTLSIDSMGIGLLARADGVDLAEALAPRDDLGPHPRPAPITAASTAEAILHRDWAAMFRERVELFPAETLPKFAEALSNLALFFGGQDVAETILPELSAWMRVVVRPVNFEEGVHPEVPLPGIAIVARFTGPEVRADQVVTAFQSVIGLSNVDRAQRGQMPMSLRLGMEGDVQVVSARFAKPGANEGVDVLYNLQPACARVRDHLVLGSHEDLVRSLVREIAAASTEDSGADRARVESLQLSGPNLARILQANMGALIARKVLEEGIVRDEAWREIEGFRALCASVSNARMSVIYSTHDRIDVEIRLDLEPTAQEGWDR